MKWIKWLPWRLVISRLARSRGFIDPVAVYARLQRFAQPSEVAETVELMRAGVILQARGLINTRAIQHNLDWVWPYWIERQFDPRDASFVPRAFSLTHVNLTHRNWTALGVPDSAQMPLVDPRGLVTPLFDGWSLDTWIVPMEGSPLLPSRSATARQQMAPGDDLLVETQTVADGLRLVNRSDVVWVEREPVCRLRAAARVEREALLVVSVRPANPEGVSFVERIERMGVDGANGGASLKVNNDAAVQFSEVPERVVMSTYREGDVFRALPEGADARRVSCDVGLATAAAVYPVCAGEGREIEVRVPLRGPSAHPEPGLKERRRSRVARVETGTGWTEALSGTCRLELPDERIVSLYRNAVRNLVLFSPDEVYPGPYTSKRFWFRDSAFLLNAMMAIGLGARAERVLEHYPGRQQVDGFFRSQEGEWDANGQAIWVLDRHRRLSGRRLSDTYVEAIRKGARWIGRKRTAASGDAPHAGLLPAGFSAEHLGPNDYFYWDDFWSAAGLRAAVGILDEAGEASEARWAEGELAGLLGAIDRSLELTGAGRRHGGVPASPYRRMDAGAIGSLAASYPTQVWRPEDPRMVATADFLFEHCTVQDGFFQDVIHSGINVYLSLHLAQVLLRAGDSRYARIVESLARLATPTGNWPEAIHPHTHGGCMGDGQHIWAAAEWVLMLRNCFVREEGEELMLASGIPEAWVVDGERLRFGPTATPHGEITVKVVGEREEVAVRWQGAWRGEAPGLIVAYGGGSRRVSDGSSEIRVPRGEASEQVM